MTLKFLLTTSLLTLLASCSSGSGAGDPTSPLENISNAYWMVFINGSKSFEGFPSEGHLLSSDNKSWEHLVSSINNTASMVVLSPHFNHTYSPESEFDGVSLNYIPNGKHQSTQKTSNTINGKSYEVQLFLDSSYDSELNPADFYSKTMVSSYQASDATITIGDSGVFTLTSKLGNILEDKDCQYTGNFPSASVNYKSIQVNVNCDDGYMGTTYSFWRASSDKSKLTIGISAPTMNHSNFIVKLQ